VKKNTLYIEKFMENSSGDKDIERKKSNKGEGDLKKNYPVQV